MTDRAKANLLIMGNVLAASALPPLSFPPPGQNPMSDSGSNEPSPAVLNDSDKEVENPGTIEDLHKKCKGILRKCLSRAPRFLHLYLSLSHYSNLYRLNLQSVIYVGVQFLSHFFFFLFNRVVKYKC